MDNMFGAFLLSIRLMDDMFGAFLLSLRLSFRHGSVEVDFTMMYSNEDASEASGIVAALQDLKRGQVLNYDGHAVEANSTSGI